MYVFTEQSQALALVSEDVSSPECVQEAEVLAAEASGTLAQARSAVATAKQNRCGFFPPSNAPSSRKGKGKGKLKGKSKDSSCLVWSRSDHFWRQCNGRQWSGGGKRMTNGTRTFHLGAACSLGSELFEAMVLQADLVMDNGATKIAGGVEAVQILVDAVTQGFPDCRVEVECRAPSTDEKRQLKDDKPGIPMIGSKVALAFYSGYRRPQNCFSVCAKVKIQNTFLVL